MSVSARYLQWVTVPAYKLCGITPSQVRDIPPSEMILMLYAKIPPEEIEKMIQQWQKEPMDDETMFTVVSTFLHPVLNAIGGPIHG